MNPEIAKRAAVFAAILGAISGLIALVPPLIGFCLFVLTFLCAPMIIIYMKKNEKHLGYINNEQGAILGGIIGFFATIGFFVSFSPMVCILKLIFKSYYTYMIPDMLKDALWLFFVIVFMVAFVFAATNSASAMGLAALYNQFETKPKDSENPLDIKIED